MGKSMMSKLSIMALIVFAMASLSATASAQPSGPIPCTDEKYRTFDFWIGEWDVFTVDKSGNKGTKVGRNIISSEEGGCLIVENWESISGSTGQSYNYFEPGKNNWRQVWVSRSFVIDYVGDLNEKGEMVLVGEITYRNGNTAPFRGIWTRLPDQTVRQHFDQFDRANEKWVPWFTGIYERIEQSKNESE